MLHAAFKNEKYILYWDNWTQIWSIWGTVLIKVTVQKDGNTAHNISSY